MIRFLHQVTGPCISLDSLRCLFPEIPCSVLRDLLSRYRRVWKKRYARRGYRLKWHRPGRVWAIDHSEASHPVDGQFPQILAVRDLASHCQLAWAPCSGTGAQEAASLLTELFDQFGPPLILKSDNGSAFISEVMSKLKNDSRVNSLFNPPRYPQYNGALERSNATLKVYTYQHAMRAGHPFRWDCEDLEKARALANEITRPWGRHGPTPQEVWESRDPISDLERAGFQESVQKHRVVARRDLGFTLDQSLNHQQRAHLDRLAISRTLEELGYLTIKLAHQPEKPKRVSRKQALKLGNVIEGSTAVNSSATEAANGVAVTQEKSETKKLALEVQSDIMLAPSGRHSVQNQIADVTPAKPKRAFTSWSGRLITPLISLAKFARIMH